MDSGSGQTSCNEHRGTVAPGIPTRQLHGRLINSDGKGKEPAQEKGLSGQMGTTNGKASYNYDKQVIGGSRQGYNLDTIMELCNQHSLAQEGCAGSDVEGLIVAEVKRRRKEGTRNGEDEDGELQDHTHQACRPTPTHPRSSGTAGTGYQARLEQ